MKKLTKANNAKKEVDTINISKHPSIKIDPENDSNVSLKNSREFSDAINSKNGARVSDILDKILRFYYSDKEACSSLEKTVNSSISTIIDSKITDPIELILVTQIIVTNELLFKCANKVNTKGQYTERFDDHVKNISKLSNTLNGYIKALNSYRNQGQQKVKVEHVHMSDGSNAVFGDVNNISRN